MKRTISLLATLAVVIFAAEGDLKWKFKAGNKLASSPAIASDGTIYIGSDGGYLYAVKPDGELKWLFSTFDWGAVHSSPAVDSNGNIYFGAVNSRVYALDSNGNMLWSYQTNDLIYSSPAISSNGTIYIGSDGLYALNPNGTLKWHYSCDEVYSSPAVCSYGNIYINAEDEYLHAIDPDGTLKWKYEIGGEGYCSPAIGDDGTIYISTDDAELYAINPDSTLKWKYTMGEQDEDHFAMCLSSPSIGADGTIYIGIDEGEISTETQYGRLYAINPDGTLKWRYQIEEWIESSATVGSDGVIYFGTVEGVASVFLYALNPNGSLRWKYSIPEGVRSSATISPNGNTLYFGADDEYLYALECSSSELDSSAWPKFRHDIRNTGRSLQPYLYANFSADPREGCCSLTVQFADESVGNPTVWHWYFGDENESAEQNPVHIYEYIGTYTVTLEVSNDSASDSKTKEDYITTQAEPQAEFSAEPLSGTSPLTVTFTDESTGSPNSWLWWFGDGHNTINQNPTHTYYSSISQTYTVSLKVSNACSVDSTVKADYIEISPSGIQEPSKIPVHLFLEEVLPCAISTSQEVIISYGIPYSSKCIIEVYDNSGRLLMTLVDDQIPAGHHKESWNLHDHKGSPVSAGVYWVRLESKAGNAISKMLLLP